MNTIYFDSGLDERAQRDRLYRGQIIVRPASPGSLRLCEFARQTLASAFVGLDPRTAQDQLPVEQYVEQLAPVKTAFVHHARCKEFIREILSELGYDLELTYFDVPRLRMVTHSGYLTTGIGYSHHAHRDTWYSAPMCQINWWLPVYEIESESSMAFHPKYWDTPVVNGSAQFNYYTWNTQRLTAAEHIRSDGRFQPRPEEPIDLEPQLRLVCPPGAMLVFSAAQLHSTVPNTTRETRYSIDFRTIHIVDLKQGRGAPNLDSAPNGVSLRDFMRASDYARIPDSFISEFEPSPPTGGTLLFQPPVNYA